MEFISFISEPKPNYQKIWDLQKSRLDQIVAGSKAEAIFFCEHEPVITLGRRSTEGNVLNLEERLPVFEIERGGDVTLHGPGQLVVYPLIKLNGPHFKGGLDAYLRMMEDVVIETFKPMGLNLGRFGPTGVWIKRSDSEPPKKIASLGVAVRRWVTYHGLSLNVKNEILENFKAIRPCNFESSVMTSLEAEGINLSLKEVSELIQNQLRYKLGLAEEVEASRVGSGTSAKSLPTF